MVVGECHGSVAKRRRLEPESQGSFLSLNSNSPDYLRLDQLSLRGA